MSTRRSAAIVSLAVMLSRVMGLVREQVFAAMFGTGKLMDAYIAAFRLPNMLRDLFAEGALSTAFTASFTKTWEKEGAPAAFHLANLVISAVLVLLGGICLVGILAAPWLVEVTNFGFHQVPGKYELTVRLTRILFPFILFVSLGAVVMGMLNARYIFGLPASASTAFNVVSVVAGVAGAYWLDPQPIWWEPHFTERALDGVCGGILLGGLAQLLIQLPGLLRIRYRFRWEFRLRDSRLHEVWRLMWPSVLAGSAVQINVLINGLFASQIDGAASWLNFAFRLMQFPIGVFGVAIATVTLPAVAREEARQDLKAFGSTVEKSLRLAFFLTIPSAIGLAVLAEPIIRVIYEHGRFNTVDTWQTAMALQAYAAGLAAYAAIKVLVPCFYALNDPMRPLRVSLYGIGLNLVLNFVLWYGLHWGHVGLAAATSSIAILNLGQLLWALRGHVDFGNWARWMQHLGAVSGAGIVCGGVAFGFNELTEPWLHYGWLGEVSGLTLTILAAAGSYAGTSWALQVGEVQELTMLLRRKLQRVALR
jgi:putative peptidoglycan lipid II flippase